MMTTIDDIVLVSVGIVLSIIFQWSQDNGRFEKKVKDAGSMSVELFKEKYGEQRKLYKFKAWNWKKWWKEHDQKFYVWIGLSIF